jgi:flagellin-like hook-associated protein FlgL
MTKIYEDAPIDASTYSAETIASIERGLQDTDCVSLGSFRRYVWRENVWDKIKKVFAAIGAVAVVVVAILAGRRNRPGGNLRDIGAATDAATGHADDARDSIGRLRTGVGDVQESIDRSAERVDDIRESNRRARDIIDGIVKAGPVRRDAGDEVP